MTRWPSSFTAYPLLHQVWGHDHTKFPEGLETRRNSRLRSLAVLGAFDSGRSDISEAHDELLGEGPW